MLGRAALQAGSDAPHPGVLGVVPVAAAREPPTSRSPTRPPFDTSASSRRRPRACAASSSPAPTRGSARPWLAAALAAALRARLASTRGARSSRSSRVSTSRRVRPARRSRAARRGGGSSRPTSVTRASLSGRSVSSASRSRARRDVSLDPGSAGGGKGRVRPALDDVVIAEGVGGLLVPLHPRLQRSATSPSTLGWPLVDRRAARVSEPSTTRCSPSRRRAPRARSSPRGGADAVALWSRASMQRSNLDVDRPLLGRRRGGDAARSCPAPTRARNSPRRAPTLPASSAGSPERRSALAARGDLHDRRVDQPLDRRVVVGVDPPSAQRGPRRPAASRRDRLQRRRQRRAAGRERARRDRRSCPRGIVLTSGLAGSRATVAKTGAHRRGQHLLQPVRVLGVADVDHHHAAAAFSCSRARRKNSLRRQVERDVGLAVGVDVDDVVAPLRRAQERPRVGGMGVEVRAAEVEQARGRLGQLAVDLDRVDGWPGRSARRRARWSRRRCRGSRRPRRRRARPRTAARAARPSSCRSATRPGR